MSLTSLQGGDDTTAAGGPEVCLISEEVGPKDVSLLDKCPGCYAQSSMEDLEVPLFQRNGTITVDVSTARQRLCGHTSGRLCPRRERSSCTQCEYEPESCRPLQWRTRQHSFPGPPDDQLETEDEKRRHCILDHHPAVPVTIH